MAIVQGIAHQRLFVLEDPSAIAAFFCASAAASTHSVGFLSYFHICCPTLTSATNKRPTLETWLPFWSYCLRMGNYLCWFAAFTESQDVRGFTLQEGPKAKSCLMLYLALKLIRGSVLYDFPRSRSTPAFWWPGCFSRNVLEKELEASLPPRLLPGDARWLMRRERMAF